MNLKRIGITIGDPAGVGPELALRLASRIGELPGIAIILIGDAKVLGRVAERVGLPMPPVIDAEEWMENSAGSTDQATGQRAVVVSVGPLDGDAVRPGEWTRDTGEASYQWVRFAVEEAIAGRIDAVVTCPIQKEAWHVAGVGYPGHTELLAEMTGVPNVRMMLTSDEISCVLATVHIPLADVASRLTQDDVFESIRLGEIALRARCQRRLGRPPRVTVCGLNPHAGEHGVISHHEEEQVIVPAIERARAAGIDVTGPLSPDTAFVPARRRMTDVFVCMYHDQGLIPLKAIAFDDAVNVTLGLPIVRTSVDHGTAMDIAWQGVASETSLWAAVRMAGELVG